MPKSIYSSRQAMYPGTYETPVADFLKKLPGYFKDLQKHQIDLGKIQLLDKRYEDEKTWREGRATIEDQNYTDELVIEAAAAAEEQTRYNTKQTEKIAATTYKKKIDQQNLIKSAFKAGDPRYLTYVINQAEADGDGESTAELTSLKKSYEDFGDDLEALNNSVNTAGDLKGIANSQLLVEDFMKKYKDDPQFTTQSAPYIQVLGYKNKLGARMAQVPGGFVTPKKWEETFGPQGRDAKILLDGLDDKMKALITTKGATGSDDYSTQIKLDDQIEQIVNDKKKLMNNFRVSTLDQARKNRNIFTRFSQIPTGSGRAVSDVLAAARTFDPNVVQEPSITEAEMADVSNQIATQQEIETNIAKINENIPGIGTTTPTDTTAITDENITALTGDDAEAYNPNKVGLDPDDPSTIPASFLEPITDGGDEAPEVVDATTAADVTDTGVGSAIIDRLLPGQVSAAEVPKVEEEPVKKEVKIDDFKVKPPSEFSSNKYRNSAANAASDLATSSSGFGIGDVEYLNNLLIQRKKAASPFRKKQVDKGIKKVSDRLKKKIGDFINPLTGEFSDPEYNDKFYSKLSLETGLSRDIIAEILKGISTVKASKSN